MYIDEDKEGKQLADDMQPMGLEALAVMTAFQKWTDQLRNNEFPLLAALSLMKAMSMIQFNFLNDTYESMSKYANPLYVRDAIPMDKLMIIADGKSDVDKEVAAAMAKEIIFLRALNGV